MIKSKKLTPRHIATLIKPTHIIMPFSYATSKKAWNISFWREKRRERGTFTAITANCPVVFARCSVVTNVADVLGHSG